jgi:hypothetical protein
MFGQLVHGSPVFSGFVSLSCNQGVPFVYLILVGRTGGLLFYDSVLGMKIMLQLKLLCPLSVQW